MSTETKTRPEDLRISDETARLILERAIQLDAQRPGDTTLAELQRVAQELNVSSGSLMEAIRELQTKAVAPVPPPVPLTPPPQMVPEPKGQGLWRTVAVGLGSFLFAALNASESPRDPEVSMLLLVCASVALVLVHRRNRTPRFFQRDLFALFAGVALGWIMSGGRGGEEVVYGSTFAWLFSSTLGGWVTRFRNNQPTTDNRNP